MDVEQEKPGDDEPNGMDEEPDKTIPLENDEAPAEADTNSSSHAPSIPQQPQIQTSAAAEHPPLQIHTKEDPPREMANERRERSRSPLPKEAALRSYNLVRKLDGMPQVEVNDPRFLSYMKTIDEELIADTINEKYLSAEDKQAFSEAKNKALQVWIDNQAWRAVDRSEAQEGELVPARMLQRWKSTKNGKVANCRVII